MVQDVTYVGIGYEVPDVNDNLWGPSLTDYLVALASGSVTKSGGNVFLTAQWNAGPNFGLAAVNYSTTSTHPAASGIISLANGDTIAWRNAANTADITLTVGSDNKFNFNGSSLGTMATQDASAVNITGGTIAGVSATFSSLNSTPLNAANISSGTVGIGFGGTGASTAGNALTNLGALGSANNLSDVGSANTSLNNILPTQSGANGKFLQTNGTSSSWVGVTASGNVNSGSSGQVAYYASSGTAVSGQSLSSLFDTSFANIQGDILYRGASTWTVLAPGTSGQVLQSGGTGANPSWLTVSGTGTVTSVATDTSLTGGPITTTGTLGLASITTGNVLANTTGSTGQPVATTPSAVLDVIGATQGDILYRNSTGWVVLAPGTSGNFLKTNGASANPAWATVSGSGTVTSVTFTGDGTLLSATPSSAVTVSGTLNAAIANANGGTVLGNNSSTSGAPAYTSAPILGVNASAAGTLGLANGSGGGHTVTIQNLGTTSAWNFNLPTGAGTAGQVLTSQAGGSTSMTWTTPAGGGTVTTSGSPASGNLTAFSGATAITNTDLTGDVTTSGTVATTVAKINGVALGSTTATSGNVLIASGTTWITKAISGDAALTAAGALTVTKTNGVSFGTSATVNTGTSGATIPLLNGANTYSGASTFSADAKMSGASLGHVVNAIGNSGTSKAIPWDSGNAQTVTITGAVTFTFTNPTNPGFYHLFITQDATGHVYSMPATVIWPGGTNPTWSTAANAKDALTVFYDGTTYWGIGQTAWAT